MSWRNNLKLFLLLIYREECKQNCCSQNLFEQGLWHFVFLGRVGGLHSRARKEIIDTVSFHNYLIKTFATPSHVYTETKQ